MPVKNENSFLFWRKCPKGKTIVKVSCIIESGGLVTFRKTQDIIVDGNSDEMTDIGNAVCRNMREVLKTIGVLPDQAGLEYKNHKECDESQRASALMVLH